MPVCHLKKFKIFVLLKSLIVANEEFEWKRSRLMSSDCIPMMSKGDLSKWYFYKLITTQNSPRNFHWTKSYAEQLEQRDLFFFSLFNVCIFVAAPLQKRLLTFCAHIFPESIAAYTFHIRCAFSFSRTHQTHFGWSTKFALFSWMIMKLSTWTRRMRIQRRKRPPFYGMQCSFAFYYS